MKRSAKKLIELIRDGRSVYSATFIFAIKASDDEFDRLNKIINEIAQNSSGFLGSERWSNDDENRRAVVYYWDNLESLTTFSNHSDHQTAKRNYKRWYSGYEVIISEVLKFRSDGGLG